MFKMARQALLGKAARTVIVAASVSLVACSTPEERIAEYTQSGNELFQQGDIQKAALEYRNALKINVDHVPALRGMLQVMEAQDNTEQVGAILTKITDLDKADVSSRVKLARLNLIYRAVDRALDYVNEALALEPDNPEALIVSAGIQLQLEDAAGAVELAQRGLSINPDLVDGYSVLAAERVRAEDPAGSLTILDDGLEKTTDQISLRLIKIQILSRTGELDKAVEVYQEVVDLQPDDEATLRDFATFLARVGRLDDAQDRLETLVGAYPDNDDYVIDLARIVNTKDGPEAAEKVLQSAISGTPERYQLRRTLAELQLSRGATQEARQTLLAISADAGDTPDGLEAKARAAQIAQSLGERDMAEKMVAEILAVDKKIATALVIDATLDVDDGELDEAISTLRGVLADTPDSVPALMLLGRAHTLNGAKDLAADRYAQAFSQSQGSPQVALTYATFLIRNESYDLAEQVLGVLIGRQPSNIEAWKRVAELRLLKLDWVGAQQAADRLAQLNDPVYAAEIRGAALSGQNNVSASIAAFEQAHSAAPDNARPLVNLIRSYVAANRLDDAQAYLTNLVGKNPEGVLPRILLSQVHLVMNKPEEALAGLQQARAIDPQDLLTHRTLYQYYVSKGDAPAAKDALADGLKALPDNITLRILKAGEFEREGDVEAAIDVYEALLKDVPNSTVVANNLASLLSDNRDDISSLRRALQLSQRLRDSQVPHFRDTYGWASYRVGQLQTALTVLEGVIETAPNLAVFRFHLGQAYAADGQTTAARKEFQQAMALIDERGGLDKSIVTQALLQLDEAEASAPASVAQ